VPGWVSLRSDTACQVGRPVAHPLQAGLGSGLVFPGGAWKGGPCHGASAQACVRDLEPPGGQAQAAGDLCPPSVWECGRQGLRQAPCGRSSSPPGWAEEGCRPGLPLRKWTRHKPRASHATGGRTRVGIGTPDKPPPQVGVPANPGPSSVPWNFVSPLPLPSCQPAATSRGSLLTRGTTHRGPSPPRQPWASEPCLLAQPQPALPRVGSRPLPQGKPCACRGVDRPSKACATGSPPPTRGSQRPGVSRIWSPCPETGQVAPHRPGSTCCLEIPASVPPTTGPFRDESPLTKVEVGLATDDQPYVVRPPGRDTKGAGRGRPGADWACGWRHDVAAMTTPHLERTDALTRDTGQAALGRKALEALPVRLDGEGQVSSGQAGVVLGMSRVAFLDVVGPCGGCPSLTPPWTSRQYGSPGAQLRQHPS
jgi:hypothetical protein